MKTFIGLTFAFLAFAFYEMSGGENFEPASAQIKDEAPVQTAAATDPTPAIRKIDTAAAPKIDDTPEVTRVALNLTNLEDAQEPSTREAVPTEAAQAPAEVTPAAVNGGSVISSAETPQIILPSLIATTPDTPRGDIREVTGNRVNVRGGPSTDYGIVGKLTRGEPVRVLEDNGNGWVLMEAVEGGTEGWMAEFLLTSG